MKPEFIFHRTPPTPNAQQAAQAASFEALLAQVERETCSPGELEEIVSSMVDCIGDLGALAVTHWFGLLTNVRQGKTITIKELTDVCLLTVGFVETVPLVMDSPEIRAAGAIVQSAEYISRTSSNTRVAALARLCVEHIRIVTEANAGNVVFRDPYLLISWRSIFGTQKPELYVCVRNQLTGLFVFIPQLFVGDTNFVPPLSSFRAARCAIATWQGQSLVGELVGSSAIRLCKVLGIEVQGDKGIIHHRRRRAA